MTFFNGNCDHDPPGSGTLKLYVQSSELPGLSSLQIKGIRADVILSDEPDGEERRVTIGPDPLSVNLVGLGDRIPSLVGMYQVPAGFVHQIRFLIETASVVIDGESSRVRIPSGPQTGLKVVPENEVPFLIKEEEITHVAILFDPAQHLLHNNGIGYHLKPVVPGREIDEPELPNYIPGRLIVRFEQGTTREQVESLCSELCNGDGQCTLISKSLKADNAFLLSLPEGIDVSQGFDFFRVKKPPVLFVLPQYITLGQATEVVRVTPNEMGSLQPQWNMELIRAPDAWTVTKGSTKIIVGVIDTGIDLDNEDLYLNIWINENELPAELTQVLPSGFKAADFDHDGVITFYDLNTVNPEEQALLEGAGITDCKQSCPGGYGRGLGDAGRRVIDPIDLIYSADPRFHDGDTDVNGYDDDIVGWNFVEGTNDPEDTSVEVGYESHGTAVAGIIGAVGDNDFGIAGLNWKVRMIPLKVLGLNAIGVFDRAYEAMIYAAEAGAMVSNASFGSVDDENFEIRQEECGNFAETEEAIAKKMLLVVPAGNKGAEIDPFDLYTMHYAICPQLSKRVFVVAGTDENRRIVPDSNRSKYKFGFTGDYCESSAPGLNVPSLHRDGYVGLFSGTSIAAAHVTGATALFLAATRNTWEDLPDDFTPSSFLWSYIQANARQYVDNLSYKVKQGSFVDALNAVSPVTWYFKYRLEKNVFDIQVDADGDGLDDGTEDEIADAFVPYLLLDEEESQRTDNGGLGCLNTIYQVTPCPEEECEGPGGLRIKYVFLYPKDYGKGGVDFHNGDNEWSAVYLRTIDGGFTYRAGKMEFSQHATSDVVQRYTRTEIGFFNGICEDFGNRYHWPFTGLSFCSDAVGWYITNLYWTGGWMPVQTRLRDDGTTHVLIHASQDKHACYRGYQICERAFDGWYNEDCDGGPLVSLELTTEDPESGDIESNNAGECYSDPLIIDDLGAFGLTCYKKKDDHVEWAWTEGEFCGGLGPDECTSPNREKWFWYPECGPQ